MQLFHEGHELSLCAAQGQWLACNQSHTLSHFPLNLFAPDGFKHDGALRKATKERGLAADVKVDI